MNKQGRTQIVTHGFCWLAQGTYLIDKLLIIDVNTNVFFLICPTIKRQEIQTSLILLRIVVIMAFCGNHVFKRWFSINVGAPHPLFNLLRSFCFVSGVAPHNKRRDYGYLQLVMTFFFRCKLSIYWPNGRLQLSVSGLMCMYIVFFPQFPFSIYYWISSNENWMQALISFPITISFLFFSFLFFSVCPFHPISFIWFKVHRFIWLNRLFHTIIYTLSNA